MTLNKYRSIASLFFIVLIACVACGGRGDTTESSIQAATEATAIVARLTIVAATDEPTLQSANAEPADPVTAPTTSAPTQRLSVEIVRAVPPTPALPTPVPPTLVPPTPVPPTATYTAVPLTLAEPTNTPILLNSEPPAPQPLIQTPETEPSELPSVASAAENNLVDESNPAAENNVVNFSGRWSTNVGVVDLEQNGDQVSGTYQLYGDNVRYALTGAVSGRTLSGNYTGFDGGTFNFVLEPDRGSFDGSWFYQGAGVANHWCGVRRGPLKPWCGFSGPWESIGDYVADRPPVTEVVQTGDRIQGTFVNGVYAETGILQGQVGREGTGSQLIATGRWSIAGFSGDFRWALQDQKSDQSIGYSITSDGVSHQWCNWRPGLSMPAECFEPK